MGVTTKLTLSLALLGLALFGGYSAMQLRQEERDLRQAVERETALLGRSLQVSLQNALRDRQVADIQQTVGVLEEIDPSVDVFVFDADGSLKANSEGAQPAALLTLPRGAMAAAGPRVEWSSTAPDGRLIMTWPLQRQAGGVAGTLVVARPLTALHEDLRATRSGAYGAVLSFAVLALLVGGVLGHLFVRRPLSRIVKTMSALRGGAALHHREALSPGGATEPLPAPPDEIGAVAAELNDLVRALADANDRLEQETEARRRLERGLQQVDKLATVGQLSAGLAHEIGSPLQVLAGRARALLGDADDPGRVRRNAEILVEQTDRITRIVEQLLTFARRRPIELRRTDLRAAVATVVELLESEARRRRISLRLDPRRDGADAVVADPGQLQQVVLNLLTNALKATAAGGTVTVRLEAARLGEAAAARLVVDDNGCGMSEEILGKLFQPFFTTRVAEGGTGLGLAVVKSIVTEHGGHVAVHSEPGRGSTFVVELPCDGPGRAEALAS